MPALREEPGGRLIPALTCIDCTGEFELTSSHRIIAICPACLVVRKAKPRGIQPAASPTAAEARQLRNARIKQDPVRLEKRRASSRKWNRLHPRKDDPVRKERRNAADRQHYATDPAYRERKKAAKRRLIQDPVQYQKKLETARRRAARPEVKARDGELRRARCRTPEAKAKRRIYVNEANRLNRLARGV